MKSKLSLKLHSFSSPLKALFKISGLGSHSKSKVLRSQGDRVSSLESRVSPKVIGLGSYFKYMPSLGKVECLLYLNKHPLEDQQIFVVFS